MATLEKIRSKGVLLLIIIGTAMIAFIIGDFLNSSTTLFSDQNKDVASINGENYKIDEYAAKIDQMSTVYKLEYGDNSLNDQMNDQIQQMVWDNLVTNSVVNQEAQEIGLQVSTAEMKEMLIGSRISPLIYQRRMFVDPETGYFNPAKVKEFITFIESDEINTYGDDAKKLKQYWTFWEDMVKNSRIQEKYITLLSKAIVVNNLEAKQAYQDNNQMATIVYAMKNYFSIPDSTINVTDAEIKALYDKKKEQYKQEESLDIRYAVFPIVPSTEDYTAVSEWINGLSEEFKTTEDIALFVNSNSDVTYRGYNLTAEDIDPDFSEFAFSGKAGDVMGPIFVNDTYKMARIIENGIVLPDSVKIRNIFVASDDKLKTAALADSIETALKGGASFEVLCQQYSKSENARANGEIGWIRENTPGFDVEIINKSFNTPVNGYFQMSMGNGINIFQVQEVGEKTNKAKVAILAREVTASSATQAKLYGEAKTFAAENTTPELMEATANEKKIALYPAAGIDKNAGSLSNMSSSRQVIRWAANAKPSEVSDVFECGQQYVVATLIRNNKKGYRPLADMKEILVREIRNEKKGKILEEQMKGKTLAQLQAENYSTDTVHNITYNSQYAGSLGVEPAVFAIAPIAELNKLSAPIAGKMGAFVFETISKSNSDKPYNEKEEIMMLTTRQQYSLYGALLETLKKNAEIEDNRIVFY